MRDLPCPCCGFLTLELEYGSYVICPVCDWEDDGVQLANPTSAGGANSRSLSEAQGVALAKYPANVEIAKGYRRSAKWRPLSAAEIEAASLSKASKHWHAMAVCSESETYWSAT
jgi:uncharacterized Zn finger protein (UPF0148 family)